MSVAHVACRHGAAKLIDEIFVEVHTTRNRCCSGPGHEWQDAIRLIQDLRAAGVYAHYFG